MKRKIRLLATLWPVICLIFMCAEARAQDPAPGSAPAGIVPDDITPLQIGDTIPEALWHIPLQVVNHPDGKETITLADYKGKLIILDFWATWCVPCIKSLYKLDTLQQQFGDELAVIPTTYEDAGKAAPFFESRGWSLSTAVNESILKTYFHYQSIPHQVWVQDGRVLAFTGHEYANADYIGKVLQGHRVDFNHKIEVAFDKNKPLFLNGNGGDGSNMLYQSIISGRLQARIGGVSKPSPNGIMAYNQTVQQLYTIALGHFISPLYSDNYIKKYIVHEISDSLRYRIDPTEILLLNDPFKTEQWANENTYCYNLALPDGFGSLDIKAKILRDLNDFFGGHLGLKGNYKTRNVEALALVTTKEIPKILTAGGKNIRKENPEIKKSMILQNESVLILIHFLNSTQKFIDKPIIDQTGIVENIDLEIDLNHTDIESLRKELSKHELDLVDRTAPVSMIVFSGGH